MEITVNISDMEFTLPKKTLKLAKMIDGAYSAVSSEDSYKKQYAFVKEVLGAEKTKELLDGDKIEDVDLVLLSYAFVKIDKAYAKPVEDVRYEDEDSSVLDKMDKIISVGNAMDKVARMGNKR